MVGIRDLKIQFITTTIATEIQNIQRLRLDKYSNTGRHLLFSNSNHSRTYGFMTIGTASAST